MGRKLFWHKLCPLSTGNIKVLMSHACTVLNTPADSELNLRTLFHGTWHFMQIQSKLWNSLNWDWSESTFSSVNLLWTPHNLEPARWSRLSLNSDISSRHINTSWELTVTVSPPGGHQIIIIGAPILPLWHDTGTGAREVSVSLLFMASSSYKEINTIWRDFH